VQQNTSNPPESLSRMKERMDSLVLPATEGEAPGDAATAIGPAPSWQTAAREWIADHDHRWLFVVVYLGLAVVLSVFVSLFWLVFMAGVHLLLECVRHLRPDWTAGQTLAHAVWEVKLDIALVLLALGAVLYIDVVLGVLGIQSAARAAAVTRAGARAASRIAAWERNVRAFLLSIDEMIRVGRAATLFWRRRDNQTIEAVIAPHHEMAPWRGRWGLGDRLAIGIIVACLLLIVGAPLLTVHTWYDVVVVLAQELRPLPT
jgi:hypothetical protein